ncbi:MAG TPA: hypothetical protein VK507_18460 [Iamia sp.]|nr:hypothetical protein [Iamia sp.]
MTTMGRAAVAIVVLATVVAGCGRGDGTEEVGVVRDLDLMEGVEAAGSARMSFRRESSVPTTGWGVAGPERRMVMEGEGVVGFATGERRWSGSLVTETIPPESAVDEYLVAPPAHLEIIGTPDGGWSRGWAEGEDAPAWTSVGGLVDADTGGDGGRLDPTATDPTAFLDSLREQAATVTAVGPDEVRGDATTRYRAELDDGDGADDDERVIEVWIDDDDRLRRVESDGMHLELWDFGTPVDVDAPTDIADPVDLGSSDGTRPTVDGDWAVAAQGTTAGAAWTVYAARADVLGAATTCRTLEVDGAAEDGSAADGGWGELEFAAHGAALATCGNGALSAGPSGFVTEPTLQVLSAGAGSLLVGFVVASEHAAGGITLVRDGADPVPLTLDPSGLAVWDGTGSAPITAIELDGGAVRCIYVTGAEDGRASLVPGETGPGIGLFPPVCLRA